MMKNKAIDPVSQKLIKTFFRSVNNLESKKVIRSSKYLGDIGEFICSRIFHLTLNIDQRAVGHDAVDENQQKVQIKINNSSQKTNQDIGDPNTYDYLLLVITNNSKMFDLKYYGYFMLVYKINCHDLEGKYIAKNFLKSLLPIKILDNNLEVVQKRIR